MAPVACPVRAGGGAGCSPGYDPLWREAPTPHHAPDRFCVGNRYGGGMRSFIERWAYVNRVCIEDAFRRAARLFPGPAFHASLFFRTDKESAMGQITVPDDQTGLTASLTFQDAEGNQTESNDPATWTSSDESVATVTPSEDGNSATFEVGAPGAAVIEAAGTNDAGDPIVAQGTITVQAGDAVIGSVEFSTGSSEPPAEPTP